MKPFLRAEFEQIPVGEHASIAVREFKVPAFQRGWHFHPEYQLTYIVHGRGKRAVGDSIEQFSPGDLVLIGGNLPHYWRSDPLPPRAGRKGWSHSITVQFKGDVLGVLPEMATARRLVALARRGRKFNGKTRDAVAEKMRGMVGLSGLDCLIELLAIFKLLAESRSANPLCSAGFVPHLDGSAADRIDRVHHFVFEHFCEQIYLEDAARIAGISPSPFCRFFRKVSGKTFSQFVNEVRIGHACKLLLESDRTVSEICYASGFNNLSNFNRHFRSVKKCTPLEYKQMVGLPGTNN